MSVVAGTKDKACRCHTFEHKNMPAESCPRIFQDSRAFSLFLKYPAAVAVG